MQLGMGTKRVPSPDVFAESEPQSLPTSDTDEEPEPRLAVMCLLEGTCVHLSMIGPAEDTRCSW